MFISEDYRNNISKSQGISLAKGMLSSFINRDIYKKCTPIENKVEKLDCKIKKVEMIIKELSMIKNKCGTGNGSEVCKYFIQQKMNHLHSKIVKYKVKMGNRAVSKYMFDPNKYYKNLRKKKY